MVKISKKKARRNRRPDTRPGFSTYLSERAVGARGTDMDISPKGAREVCAFIRGKKVEDAITDLEDVVEMKKAVPYPHYRSAGHRKGKGFGPGRYPIKAAAAVLKVLRSADNNANEMARTEDSSQMKIIHASTSLGRKYENFFPRAHGRSSPKVKQLVHVEIVLEDPTFEVAED